MNHRGMKYPTTFPPTNDHGRHYGACLKGRTRTNPLLAPRSPARPGPHYGTNPVHLTKTRSLRTYFSAEHSCPGPTHLPRPRLDRGRRVGRSKPNSATQDLSVLFCRPPWLNDPSPSV